VADKDGKTLFKCRVGCSQESVIEKLKDLGLWPTGNGHANGKGRGLTLDDFASAKGFNSQFLTQCKVAEEKGLADLPLLIDEWPARSTSAGTTRTRGRGSRIGGEKEREAKH
jgi:hypothetical protein